MIYGIAILLALGLAIDAPELARPGEHAVGVATIEFVDAVRGDRRLAVDLWYPAVAAAGAAPEIYSGSLTAEPPRRASPTPATCPSW